MDTLRFVVVVHNHQPAGNDPGIIGAIAQVAYRPLLAALREAPWLRHALHVRGPLLQWMEGAGAPFLEALGEMVARGQVELLTGGLYEPVLAAIPSADRIAQVAALSDRLERRFGVRPQGLWLTQRVWDPQIAPDLVAACVRYACMDDRAFIAAGIAREDLTAHFLTEEGGDRLVVFPIDQRLRFLIPWEPVGQAERYLEERAAAGQRVAVYGDDGETFGAWPETHEKVDGAGAACRRRGTGPATGGCGGRAPRGPLLPSHRVLRRDGGMGAPPSARRRDRAAPRAGWRGVGAIPPLHPGQPLEARPDPVPRGQPRPQEDAGPSGPPAQGRPLAAGVGRPAWIRLAPGRAGCPAGAGPRRGGHGCGPGRTPGSVGALRRLLRHGAAPPGRHAGGVDPFSARGQRSQGGEPAARAASRQGSRGGGAGPGGPGRRAPPRRPRGPGLRSMGPGRVARPVPGRPALGPSPGVPGAGGTGRLRGRAIHAHDRGRRGRPGPPQDRPDPGGPPGGGGAKTRALRRARATARTIRGDRLRPGGVRRVVGRRVARLPAGARRRPGTDRASGVADGTRCRFVEEGGAGRTLEIAWGRPAQVLVSPARTLSQTERGFEMACQGHGVVLAFPIRLEPAGPPWSLELAAAIR